MAEIVPQKAGSEKDLKAPEGDFQEWNENTSKNGQVYFTRDVDKEGKTATKPADESEHEVDSHGPSFDNEPCNWKKNTSGNTSEAFKNKTGITWYKLQNTIGNTYQLTIDTNSTYNYFFNTPKDIYNLDVNVTWWTHEVTYTTYDPTVTSVSGK